jgi:histone arginine demethylase JMJD6
MKYFMKYLRYNQDDSPLYVFDGSFDDDAVSKSLLQDFHVPSYFPDDLFSLVGEKRRPPYRWFLVGPARSGSCVHIDPLGTSAWNTLLHGRKRWVLFPPGTPKAIAKGLDVIRKGEDDEAVNYFVDILPRIHKTYGDHTRIIEFTQEAGETVFVPGGWWHSVLNIEDTIAVTQVNH